MSSTCSSIGVKPKYVKKSGKENITMVFRPQHIVESEKLLSMIQKQGKRLETILSRAARQRSVRDELVEKAKSASFSELQEMVSGVMKCQH